MIRSLLHRVITTDRGDSLGAVRVPKAIARELNEMLGSPICSAEEIERRRAAGRRLEELRRAPAEVVTRREPAPVMVYFEKDRNQRQLTRIEEALSARNIAFKKLDVAGDEATKAFVMKEARCEEDDLPIVFVAGTAVGGLRELVAFDASGELVKAVFGPDHPRP